MPKEDPFPPLPVQLFNDVLFVEYVPDADGMEFPDAHTTIDMIGDGDYVGVYKLIDIVHVSVTRETTSVMDQVNAGKKAKALKKRDEERLKKR